MGIFIRLDVDRQKCVGVEKCGVCIDICPVNVFEKTSQEMVINDENEDECTLCGLCLEKCVHDALKITKLYDE